MRRSLAVLMVLSASHALFAQDAGELTVPPPTVIVPVETVFMVRPVAVSFLQVLISGVASPEQIRAAVATMSVADLSQVIVALANNPKALSLLVSQLETAKLAAVVANVAESVAQPAPVSVRQASIDALAGILVSAANNPEKLNALVGVINSPALLFQVVMALVKSEPSPTVFAQIVNSNPRIEVTLLTFDLSRWMAVRELTEGLTAYEGNWLGSAVGHLRKRIAREGYSDGVMAEYQQLKNRLSQPAINSGNK